MYAYWRIYSYSLLRISKWAFRDLNQVASVIHPNYEPFSLTTYGPKSYSLFNWSISLCFCFSLFVNENILGQVAPHMQQILEIFISLTSTCIFDCIPILYVRLSISDSFGIAFEKRMKCFKHFFSHLFDEYAYFYNRFRCTYSILPLRCIWSCWANTYTWKSISYPIKNEFDHLFW